MPRPDFISRRPFIPDFLLKDKSEGRFVIAVPAIGWDQQAGLNLGVVGFLLRQRQEQRSVLPHHVLPATDFRDCLGEP